MQTAVLCDFDGTVYRGDVYEDLLIKYGNSHAQELFDRYRSGELGSKGVLEQGWRTFTESRSILEEELYGMEIDPDFPEFVSWCRTSEWEVGILSDGLDWYIRPLLVSAGLEEIPIYANELRFEGDRPLFSYPYLDTSCTLCGERFAVCKRSVIQSFQERGSRAVFIGDGSSDRCAAQQADVVIARRKLRTYCREEQIPFISFETFSDIMAQTMLIREKSVAEKS